MLPGSGAATKELAGNIQISLSSQDKKLSAGEMDGVNGKDEDEDDGDEGETEIPLSEWYLSTSMCGLDRPLSAARENKKLGPCHVVLTRSSAPPRGQPRPAPVVLQGKTFFTTIQRSQDHDLQISIVDQNLGKKDNKWTFEFRRQILNLPNKAETTKSGVLMRKKILCGKPGGKRTKVERETDICADVLDAFEKLRVNEGDLGPMEEVMKSTCEIYER